MELQKDLGSYEEILGIQPRHRLVPRLPSKNKNLPIALGN